MKSVASFIAIAVTLVIAACVTINVYFPAAAAEAAADRFIERVIGEEVGLPPEGSEGGSASSWSPLDFFFSPAYAQEADIDINTPAVVEIQERMRRRFDDELSSHFDSGAIGLTNDAMVAVRDLAAVGLAQRNALRQAVAAENRDRAAVYREIAVANGHPEWEGQIRSTFAQRWISNARPGWHYQDSGGAWQTK